MLINLYRKRGNFEKVVHSESADWKVDGNREMLRAMMMTACDVAAITKPWEIQQKVRSIKEAHLKFASTFCHVFCVSIVE